jgi:DNA segregation ATPase FtsK/SpoIIIE-like protein
MGNKKAKQFWNPKNVPFPYDDDDKDEIYIYFRNKYIHGKFRYSPPSPDDYNLGSGHSRGSSRPSARSSRPSSAVVPTLSQRDIPEMQRLKYRKIEPKLRQMGFHNTDDNYEALVLSKGDVQLAAEILAKSDDSNEKKPPLPRRPGSVAAPATSSEPQQQSTEWWAGRGSAAVGSALAGVTGLMTEPPQQYLDPATGIIYVDPVLQQQWELQQQQLMMQQGTMYQPQQQITQQTGIEKSQLLSLYNQPTGVQQQQPQQPQQVGFPQQLVQQTGVPQQQFQQTGFPQAGYQQTGFQQQQQFYPSGAQQQGFQGLGYH